MNILILIAIGLGAASAPAPRFDLQLNQRDGKRLVAIVDPETGLFSAAAGQDDLSILSGEAARAALLALHSSDEPVVEIGGDPSDAEAASGRKIIVHKMDYEEDLSGADESPQQRVIRRTRPDGEFAFNFDDAEDPAPAAPSTADRIIRIHGADAAKAADFIDRLDGLDAEEKRRMKEAVGL